jgi:hypothetical protein
MHMVISPSHWVHASLELNTDMNCESTALGSKKFTENNNLMPSERIMNANHDLSTQFIGRSSQ